MKTYQSSTKDKRKNFFKRHWRAAIVAASVVAVAAIVAVSVVFSLPDSEPVDAPVVEPPPVVDVEPKVVMPMTGSQVGLDYAYDSLKWNDTLEMWKYHPGVDFIGDGDVVAILDGTVKSVEKTTLEGNVVTVEHADGLVSVYKSLGDNVAVKAGDPVRSGDKLGVAASSMSELNTGAHLHLEVKKNGKHVDPMTILPQNDDK